MFDFFDFFRRLRRKNCFKPKGLNDEPPIRAVRQTGFTNVEILKASCCAYTSNHRYGLLFNLDIQIDIIVKNLDRTICDWQNLAKLPDNTDTAVSIDAEERTRPQHTVSERK
jgi:hypothetical protein